MPTIARIKATTGSEPAGVAVARTAGEVGMDVYADPGLLEVVDPGGDGRRTHRLLQRLARELTAAETEAVRAVRNQAIQVAMAAATEVLGRQMGPRDRSAGIDRAIDDVARHLN